MRKCLQLNLPYIHSTAKTGITNTAWSLKPKDRAMQIMEGMGLSSKASAMLSTASAT